MILKLRSIYENTRFHLGWMNLLLFVVMLISVWILPYKSSWEGRSALYQISAILFYVWILSATLAKFAMFTVQGRYRGWNMINLGLAIGWFVFNTISPDHVNIDLPANVLSLPITLIQVWTGAWVITDICEIVL